MAFLDSLCAENGAAVLEEGPSERIVQRALSEEATESYLVSEKKTRCSAAPIAVPFSRRNRIARTSSYLRSRTP